MTFRNHVWLRISGIAGLFTPILAFTFILLAIAYSPNFVWTENALSDLGIQEGLTAPLFNYGLIVSGILALTFATGLFPLLPKKILGRTGELTYILATLALTAIGVFPENATPMHYYVSLMFFFFCPLSMLFITVTFAKSGNKKLGVFTLAAALIAVASWVLQFAVHYVNDVAVPETISALAASAWSMVLGYNMLRRSSQAN
jgi:hypothetical membrane protein